MWDKCDRTVCELFETGREVNWDCSYLRTGNTVEVSNKDSGTRRTTPARALHLARRPDAGGRDPYRDREGRGIPEPRANRKAREDRTETTTQVKTVGSTVPKGRRPDPTALSVGQRGYHSCLGRRGSHSTRRCDVRTSREDRGSAQDDDARYAPAREVQERDLEVAAGTDYPGTGTGTDVLPRRTRRRGDVLRSRSGRRVACSECSCVGDLAGD